MRYKLRTFIIKLTDLFNRLLNRYDNQSLRHVYTYNKADLPKHFANEIKNLKLAPKDKVVLIGSQKDIQVTKALAGLPTNNVQRIKFDLKDGPKQNITKIKNIKPAGVKVIVITDDNPKVVRFIASVLLDTLKLKNIPLILKVSVADYHKSTRKFDVLPKDVGFIDDNLDFEFFYKTYEQSLNIFEQKCQIKDAWDIYQSLNLTKQIPGDIIEVGSYKGHSGWLIDKFARQLSKNKRNIYLLDMFSEFPSEDLGIDNTWSNTHQVSFEDVKRKFSDNKNVTFVKGDIRETLPSLKTNKWSFAFIDVDSYDATLSALQNVFPRLQKGGVVLCEDYGESHCLGARMAIDQFFADKKVFSFFSFFSGCKSFFKY